MKGAGHRGRPLPGLAAAGAWTDSRLPPCPAAAGKGNGTLTDYYLYVNDSPNEPQCGGSTLAFATACDYKWVPRAGCGSSAALAQQLASRLRAPPSRVTPAPCAAAAPHPHANCTTPCPHCRADSKRPYWGAINYCKNFWGKDRDSQILTTLHEMTHALVRLSCRSPLPLCCCVDRLDPRRRRACTSWAASAATAARGVCGAACCTCSSHARRPKQPSAASQPPSSRLHPLRPAPQGFTPPFYKLFAAQPANVTLKNQFGKSYIGIKTPKVGLPAAESAAPRPRLYCTEGLFTARNFVLRSCPWGTLMPSARATHQPCEQCGVCCSSLPNRAEVHRAQCALSS